MKTTMHYIVALTIGVAMITISCQKKPTAQISASKAQVRVHEQVSFDNQSLNANSYEWDFGDGKYSSSRSPNHTWTKSGTYPVKMTAFSKNGKKIDVEEISIKVIHPYVGTYSVADSYNSYNCGSDDIAYTITITEGTTANNVIIDNFANRFNNVQGEITFYPIFAGMDVLEIPLKVGITDKNGAQWEMSNTWTFLSGNSFHLSYQIDDSAYDDICGHLSGSFNASK